MAKTESLFFSDKSDKLNINHAQENAVLFLTYYLYFNCNNLKETEPGKVLCIHYALRQKTLHTSKRVSIRLQRSELHPPANISPHVSVINLHTRNRAATPNKLEKCEL